MTVRTALVTGANGFVGAHVVRALVACAALMCGPLLAAARTRALDGVDCEIVIGDLRDLESVERAVDGCDEVYHVAADYRLWVLDEAAMYAANVGGTRNLLAASKRAGVAKIVHTSTVGALGIGADKVGREDTPVALERYGRSCTSDRNFSRSRTRSRPRVKVCRW